MWIVSAQEMAAAETAVFAAGLPVEALMEKAGLALFAALCHDYPQAQHLGVLVGSGHNGADALVVAREWLLAKRGTVTIWQLSQSLKPLTATQAQYVHFLGGQWAESVAELSNCDLLLDGLFGWGLNRPLDAASQALITTINALPPPRVSVDLPSGLDADTGAGAAIRAEHTYCLGFWKRGLVQEAALAYTGRVQVLDIGLPTSAIPASCRTQALTSANLAAWRPTRSPTSHKYQRGHLLLLAGSETYPGAAILAGLGARPSGVGMVTLAVPRALVPLVVAQLPEMLVLPYDQSPLELDLERYSALAIGPGLTASAWLPDVLCLPIPIVLDAGGLVPLILSLLPQRSAPTILTPHWGEFRCLFPVATEPDRLSLAEAAARQTQAAIVLKGAHTLIATPIRTWVNLDSTPALARGGSGDVLTGLIGGLLAQGCPEAAALGVGWHARAALLCEAERGQVGVDPLSLASYLSRAMAAL